MIVRIFTLIGLLLMLFIAVTFVMSAQHKRERAGSPLAQRMKQQEQEEEEDRKYSNAREGVLTDEEWRQAHPGVQRDYPPWRTYIADMPQGVRDIDVNYVLDGEGVQRDWKELVRQRLHPEIMPVPPANEPRLVTRAWLIYGLTVLSLAQVAAICPSLVSALPAARYTD